MQTTIGSPTSSAFVRCTVFCKRLNSASVRGKHCLGKCSRERGQRRLPTPPDKITGIIFTQSPSGRAKNNRRSITKLTNKKHENAEVKDKCGKHTPPAPPLLNTSGRLYTALLASALSSFFDQFFQICILFFFHPCDTPSFF